MKFWERIAVQAQQEIYYYDTHRGFDARNLAGRLYEMILDELDRGKKGVFTGGNPAQHSLDI